MSTSDNTPTDDQRLDRLYKTLNQPEHQNFSDSTSPADLDELIRHAAKTTHQPDTSGYWHWQQRFGWATAAAVVLTSALFLALPDSKPGLSNVSQEILPERRLNEPTTPVATVDAAADTPQEAAQDVSAPPEVGMSMPAMNPAKELPKARLTPPMPAPSVASADPARQRRTEAPAITSKRSELRYDDLNIEEVVVTGSYRNPNCEPIDGGLIERICSVPGRNRSYVLHPVATSKCKELRLVRQPGRPEPDAESTPEQFVYTLGKRKFSATCERGNWVVQPFARGR